MKVRDAMSRNVEVIAPETSVHEAARRMSRLDAGALPVAEHDRVIGMITDRDVAIRVVAANLNPASTKVREAMTPQVEWCFDDANVADVAAKMAERRVRRVPVVNRDRRLVGILSMGDLAREEAGKATITAVHGVSQPGGPHAQTAFSGDKPEGSR